MSRVTMSGSRAWICCSASCPLRAVPTTRNSLDAPTISAISFRMNALSSTTSTERTLDGALDDTLPRAKRLHDEPAVVGVEIDGAPVVAADVLREKRDPVLAQHASRRVGVALAHVHAARRQEGAE